ncbi:MAG: GPR endopeptidase [Lachnospiraceae bacterium]|nr:GPR endopeptidase [Lachnospiraceae bacterium]
MREFMIRTDLAVEAKEQYEGETGQLQGVLVETSHLEGTNGNLTKVTILNKEGAQALQKPIGTYLTIEAEDLPKPDTDYHSQISKELSKQLLALLPENDRTSILVVGLGNRDVTPDALGPKVVEHLCITRHIRLSNLPSPLKKKYDISGIIPGVMAQTGMETYEIIKGIVEETHPSAVLVIDALAARNTKRLNTTIQLSDTGIHPGSGVGNHRKALTQETLGVPTISIGVPMVIDAATIAADTMEHFITALEEVHIVEGLSQTIENFNEEEKHQLILELMDERLRKMYVTPKDVDASVDQISFTISEAINLAFAI